MQHCRCTGCLQLEGGQCFLSHRTEPSRQMQATHVSEESSHISPFARSRPSWRQPTRYAHAGTLCNQSLKVFNLVSNLGKNESYPRRSDSTPAGWGVNMTQRGRVCADSGQHHRYKRTIDSYQKGGRTVDCVCRSAFQTHSQLEALGEKIGVKGQIVKLIIFPYYVAYYFVVVTGTSGTAVSRQQIGVRARQLRTPLHQTLDIPILQYKHKTLWRDRGDETQELCLKHDCFYDAAASPARVGRVGKILSIGILFSSIVASWSKSAWFKELIQCVQFSNRKCLFPDRCSCFDSIARTEERCSEDGDTAFAGIQSSRSHTCIPHTHSVGLEKPLRPQKHGFQRSNLWKASE